MRTILNKFGFCGLPQIALVLVAALSLELQIMLHDSAQEKRNLERELRRLLHNLPTDVGSSVDEAPVGPALAGQSKA